MLKYIKDKIGLEQVFSASMILLIIILYFLIYPLIALIMTKFGLWKISIWWMPPIMLGFNIGYSAFVLMVFKEDMARIISSKLYWLEKIFSIPLIVIKSQYGFKFASKWNLASINLFVPKRYKLNLIPDFNNEYSGKPFIRYEHFTYSKLQLPIPQKITHDPVHRRNTRTILGTYTYTELLNNLEDDYVKHNPAGAILNEIMKNKE